MVLKSNSKILQVQSQAVYPRKARQEQQSINKTFLFTSFKNFMWTRNTGDTLQDIEEV